MWVETHRPKDLEEVVGNVETRRKLYVWLAKWKPGVRAALLVGPPGSGKTTTVHLLADKMGMNLVELNASDTRTKERLTKKLGEAISSTNLYGTRSLIFLDEVDGLAGRSDYGAIDFIKDAVRKSENPVVMAANDPEADEVRKLSNVTTKMPFGRIDAAEVVGRLRAVAESEGLVADDAELAGVAEKANGDMRAAINSLQSGLPAAKDEELTTSQAINSFFGSHNREGALKALRAYPGQPRDKVRDIFAAVARAKILEERRAAALDAVSRADVLMGRIFRGQDWRLLRYLDSMLASDVWEAVGDGGAAYTVDAVPWLLQLRIWNDSRKLKDIAHSAGRRLGISARGSLVEDVPYLMLMCRDRQFREEFVASLGLEENYAAFVEKEAFRRR
ncbi:MAG: AAA family ATPase [Thaumarchaeota archaeon]|nr:AAA family ATPase [Nitrososphaerota archaeon]